jgi:Tol biopolymer transport system component
MPRIVPLLSALLILLAGCALPLPGAPLATSRASTNLTAATPSAVVAASPAAVGDGWSLYADPQFQVILRYPLAWSAPYNPGESVIRSGSDGFFQLTAASVAGPTAEGVCRQALEPAAIAKDPQFGTAPTMQMLTVAGQPACLILPSPDQRKSQEHPHVSLLVAQYPEAMRPHSQLHLWADTDHIRDIARTLAFVATPITPTASASSLPVPTTEAAPAATGLPSQTARIVFEARSDTGADIFSMNPDGSDVSQLTHGPGLNLGPACSPDGRRIAFSSLRNNSRHLYVMNADGSQERQLTDGLGNQAEPAWSPDGQRIAFNENADDAWVDNAFDVINADGSGKARLPVAGDRLYAPAWSPDGQRLAYESAQAGSTDLHVVNLDGSGDTNLTQGTGYANQPAWSPDGKQIAFWGNLSGGNSFEIYVINADAQGRFGSGSAVRRLTYTPDGQASRNHYGSAWSPDGWQIAFHSDQTGANSIYLMNADGSGLVRLTSGDPLRPGEGEAYNPCWLPKPTPAAARLTPEAAAPTPRSHELSSAASSAPLRAVTPTLAVLAYISSTVVSATFPATEEALVAGDRLFFVAPSNREPAGWSRDALFSHNLSTGQTALLTTSTYGDTDSICCLHASQDWLVWLTRLSPAPQSEGSTGDIVVP